MPREPGRGADGPRVLLGRDHQRLRQLLTGLVEEFEEGDPDDLRDTWARFEEHLQAHLGAGESHILPLFDAVEPAEARALRAEHVAFRRTVEELAVGVDLHAVRLDAVREFADALRRHAEREDRLMYRFAEREVPEADREAIARAVGGDRAARRDEE